MDERSHGNTGNGEEIAGSEERSPLLMTAIDVITTTGADDVANVGPGMSFEDTRLRVQTPGGVLRGP